MSFSCFSYWEKLLEWKPKPVFSTISITLPLLLLGEIIGMETVELVPNSKIRKPCFSYWEKLLEWKQSSGMPSPVSYCLASPIGRNYWNGNLVGSSDPLFDGEPASPIGRNYWNGNSKKTDCCFVHMSSFSYWEKLLEWKLLESHYSPSPQKRFSYWEKLLEWKLS